VAEPVWDQEVDVVVVGLGAAGSAAAVEAAGRGLEVLALDRWARGGASARSGGVVYAGGGTPQQQAAGFSDDPEQMRRYLSLEEDLPDHDGLLRRFCERSREDLAWLAELGAGVPSGFDPTKAIVPTDDGSGLYFSGNEKHYAAQTPAVPRGHRIAGRGLTGYALVDALHGAVRARGVETLDRARLVSLVSNGDGGVAGVEVLVLSGDPFARAAHAVLYRLIDGAGPLLRRVPRALTGAAERLEAARGHRRRIRARDGVILATGGFSYNRELLARHAPAYARTMPLGTAGDDGSGILAAEALGATVRLMDRCGASRFYAPPTSFAAGVLVDTAGERICDESLYAATLSARIADRGGRAWLIVDEAVRARARAEILAAPTPRGRPWGDLLRGRANHVLFPWLFGPLNLYVNRRRGRSLPELAARCGLPAGPLARTLEDYNAMARLGGADPLDKPSELVRPLEHPPYSAVRCDLGSIVFPAPCITLGGLDVDDAQRVRRADGSVIGGLYAAGRCAAGVASRSYVSGLSLADAVFSGRSAGMTVAAARGTAVRGSERHAGVGAGG